MDARRHAISFLYRAKLLRPLLHLAAPGAGKNAERVLVEVIGGDVELGLVLRLCRRGKSVRQRRPAGPRRIRQDQVRQRPIELQPLEIGIEGLARDSRGLDIGPERFEPSGETLLDRALIDGDFALRRLRFPRQRREREHEAKTSAHELQYRRCHAQSPWPTNDSRASSPNSGGGFKAPPRHLARLTRRRDIRSTAFPRRAHGPRSYRGGRAWASSRGPCRCARPSPRSPRGPLPGAAPCGPETRFARSA